MVKMLPAGPAAVDGGHDVHVDRGPAAWHAALVLLALVATSCVPSGKPAVPGVFVERNMAIGQTATLQTAWNSTCTDLTRKSNDQTTSCFYKNYRLKVACNPKCGLPKGNTFNVGGDGDIPIVPLKLGPLDVTVTMTRNSGDVYRKVVPITVRLPDRVSFACYTRGGGYRNYFPSCSDKQPVDAAVPDVVVCVGLQGQESAKNSLLTINGAPPHPVPYPDPVYQQMPDCVVVSLADLFPDRRQGKGVAPGTYPVTAAVGSFNATMNVVAK